MRVFKGLGKCTHAETIIASQLAATAAKDQGWVGVPNAKSIGWAIYAAGFLIWLFGFLSEGHAPVFHWDVATPWWISIFVRNLESELGLALMFASMVPIYWSARRGTSVMRGATTSSRPDPLARLLAYSMLLVFGAVTLAWWGFLAWLIWHMI